MAILAGIIVTLGGIAGIILTALTLPGTWLAVIVALLAQWWHIWKYDENMFSWWSIGVCIALAVIAELVEFFASAVGAKKAGGTRRGGIGSIIGGLVGAVLGTIWLAFLPIIGTIIGAAVGAGLGALLAERTGKDMSWGRATKVGAGAAAGRLAATIAKTAFAVGIGSILAVDSFV